MSDKDWFESMPSPFVKPAATVHGTESGEPKCNNPLHAMTDGTLHPHEIGASCMAGATPPASQPTVTLDRETFDTVVLAFERAIRQWAGYAEDRVAEPLEDAKHAEGELYRWAMSALALLRAAERQQ